MFKKQMQVLLVGFFIVGMSACGLALKNSIRNYMPTSQYRKVVVVPFKTSAGNPAAGEAAADALAGQLDDLGFMIVDRKFFEKTVEERLPNAAQFTLSDLGAIAKDLGITAIITGQVTETGERQEKVAATLETRNDMNSYQYDSYDRWGRPVGNEIYAKGEGEQTVVKFSATAKMTDVQTGTVLWAGARSDNFINSTIQKVANSVMEQMAISLGKKMKQMKY